MPVATITLESPSDSVVISAPTDDYLDADVILGTDPKMMYDASFTVRTQSGAFETGGRPVGESVPIRMPVLAFWLTPESRKRFQKLWGTPYHLNKVKCTWHGPSGPRFLWLKLAKDIEYTTEDGFDADIDKVYHAVVSANVYNPMYEGPEDVSEWINPGDRFTVAISADGGTFTVTVDGQTTTALPFNVSAAAFQSALAALSSVGAGNVTVTGTTATTTTPSNFVVQFASAPGSITSENDDLTAGGIWGDLGWVDGKVIIQGACTGWFEVWNPTDQFLWPEWEFDPATSWQFPDFGFGQERKWNRPVGSDAARMIVTPELTQLLSVMSDPLMDTYVSADLSNAAGLFNGVEPVYPVPPYTGTEDDPILMPVICNGPAGAKATLRQRRFWSAESGLE